ncbi:MAG: SPOR domain-containing protein [Chitinophagales bacterium]|nr:SPOR domain-containing protein [Chitinophagales bacterium]
MKLLSLKIAVAVACGLCSAVGFAQDSMQVNTHKNYTIYQDEKIAELSEKYVEFNRKREFTDGYRIQVTYTNVRDEVYQSKGAMYKQFPDLVSYVEYEQPYYKLRLGDFKTRLEATYYLQQVIALYPGAFIVKDKIKTK